MVILAEEDDYKAARQDPTEPIEVRRLTESNVTLGTAVAGFGVNTLDIFASSFGITKRGDINDAILDPEGRTYAVLQANQAGFNMATGIASIVSQGFLVSKLVAPVGKIAAQVIKGSSLGGKLSPYTLTQERLQKLQNVTTRAAYGDEGLDGVALGMYGRASLGRPKATINQLGTSIKRQGFYQGAAFGAGTEALLYATNRTNQTFYPVDQVGTNVALAAVGVLLPAGIERIAYGGINKRILASSTNAKALANALDVNKMGEIFDTALHESGKAGQQVRGGGVQTDLATLEFLQGAAKEASAPTSLSLKAAHVASGQSNMQQGFDYVQSVTREGLLGTADSGFGLAAGKSQGASNAFGETVTAYVKANPTAVLGTERIAAIREGVNPLRMKQDHKASLEGIIQKSQKVLESATTSDAEKVLAQKSLQRARWEQDNLEYFVLFNRELIPVEEFKGLTFAQGLKPRQSAKDINSIIVDGSGVLVQKDGRIFAGKDVDITKLNPRTKKGFQTVQAIYAGLEHAAKIMAKDEKALFHVPKNPNRFQLDFAERLIALGGERKVSFPKGMTKESARVESLALKFEEFKALKDKAVQSQKSLDFSAADRYFFNLPRIRSAEQGLTGNQSTFIDHLFQGVKNADEIRAFDLDQLERAAGSFRSNSTLFEHGKIDSSLRGNAFDASITTGSRQAQPVMFVQRNLDPETFTRQGLERRLANEMADTFQSLMNSGTLVGALAQDIVTSSLFQTAIDLRTLTDAGFSGTLAKATAIQEVLHRNHPTLRAVADLQDQVRRVLQSQYLADMKLVGEVDSIANLSAKLRTPTNRAASQLLNQTITEIDNGWDLSAGFVRMDNGKYGIELEGTAFNRQRWRELFPGSEMPEGALMPLKNGNPAVVDELGRDWMLSFKKMTDFLANEQNAQLKAKGRRGFKVRNHYNIPRSVAGKHVAFVVDPDMNKALQRIEGNTQKQLEENIAFLKADKDSLLNRTNAEVRTQAQIERHISIWSPNAPTGLMDPNLPTAKIGRQNKGASASPFVRENAWQDQIAGARKLYNRLGRDVMEQIFEPQLIIAKHNSNTLNRSVKNTFGGETVKTGENIHDVFRRTVLGQAAINAPESRLGGAYRMVESLTDSALASLSERVIRWEQNPFSGTAKARREFQELSSEIGEHMPFKTVDEFIQSRVGNKAVITSRELVTKLNYLTASMMLRWGEVSHSILNMAGLVANLPAVVKWSVPRLGETAEAFKKRTGIVGDIYESGGQPIAVMSMTKLLQRAIKRVGNPKAEKDHAYRMAMGYLTQDVAEIHDLTRQLTKVDTPLGRFKQKADKILSFLSDKSEQYTRSYAHMVGVELAENLGIQGRVAVEAYAHKFANSVIADYNPLTRPKVFQGTVGAPIGLFQSFGLQWFSNAFKYIENREYRNLAIAYGMQFGMFGAMSVPGMTALNDLTNFTSDGKNDIYDRIYQAHGQTAGDLVTSGIVSNIPLLFGGEAVDFAGRGQMNPRIPFASGPLPGMSMVQSFGKGMGEAFSVFRKGHGDLTAGQVAQIFAVALSNRPASGMLEVLAGESIDSRGNLIRDIQLNSMEAVYKIMGTRTLAETKQREALWKNRQQKMIRLAQRARGLKAARIAIRSGNIEALASFMEEYLATGGNPATLGQVIEDLLVDSHVPKQQQQMLEALRSFDKFNNVERLLDAGSAE